MRPGVDYKTDEAFGEGGFATVYAGRLVSNEARARGNGALCAVKVIKPQPNATKAM